MSMDGAIYVVRLLEIAIHKITLDDRGRIVWPKCLGEQALPPIDGVLCLFDSTDLRSVSQYPQVLDALRKSTNIPFLVIACKCDGPQNESQQDPLTLVQACRSLLGLKVQRISASHPESHKKCISTILRAIIMRSAETKTNTHDGTTDGAGPLLPEVLSSIHHEPDNNQEGQDFNQRASASASLPLPARRPFVLAPLGAFAASFPLSITLNSLPAFSTHASHRPKRKEEKSEDEERRRGQEKEELCAIPLLWLL
ncbi:hypothetical protein GY632_7556 [Trichophyton interdigitale]|nr:hypothetical protein GY632_7556 [Trichophyton interdigitale]